MSKLETTKRYYQTINILRNKKQATFQQIAEAIEEDGFSKGTISLRTFQRDIKDIETLHGIVIKFDKKNNCYRIHEDLSDEIEKRYLETFDLVNALKNRENVSQYIHLDNRYTSGTKYIHGLLYAIQNHLQIEFSYQKFYKHNIDNRTVEPLALKEFRYRWYLFARDVNDSRIKSYALDRITEMQITNISFVPDISFNIHEYMRYSFGIFAPQDEQPQEIILSFTAFQGNYIKTLPLHTSQKILVDDESKDELRISLYVIPSFDLKMEILSYGDSVKVIAPQALADEIKDIHNKSAARY